METTMPETPSPILARQEMENLLPDYAFGMLNARDVERFEASLHKYPDLQEEIRLIRESFSHVRSEFEQSERAHAQRLKNLTVHIQERLRSEQERTLRQRQLMKYLIPVVATCILAILIVLPRQWGSGVSDTSSSSLISNTAQNSSGSAALLLHPDDVQGLEDSSMLTTGLLEADATVNDNTLAEVIEQQLTAQEETKAAKSMLHKETLQALAYSTSAFHGYFDNSAAMQDLSEADVALVAAALTAL